MTIISTTPLWGQAWQLVVTATDMSGKSTATTISGVDWEPEPLRITFDVMKSITQVPWYADISIYNLNSPDVQNLLLTATWATLSAGFMTGPNIFSIIWDGPVLQTLYTREEVVDQKITLHCIGGPSPLALNNVIAFSQGRGTTQAQVLATMAQETGQVPISAAQGTLGTVASQRVNAVQYPRGTTVFDVSGEITDRVASSNFVQSWSDGKKTFMSEIDSGNTGPPNLIYAPPYPPGSIPATQDLPPGTTQSIVGTPQQFPQGAVFTVLLDPRLTVGLPPLLVQLVRLKTISQLTLTQGGDLPSPLSANLLYFVSQVRHVGDSRGNDWHTEVTGFSAAYAQALVLALATPST
jgi:hypothetical protein